LLQNFSFTTQNLTNSSSLLPLYAADTYFTGDGGRGARLAVAAPKGKNLAADEAWLPLYVQGMLTGNFNKYSAMTIIDRLNLDKVVAEQNLSLSGNYSDDDYISIGKLTNAQYILAGSIEKTRGEQFTVQWSITALDTGILRAAFSKTCTASELRGGTVLNEASADLLAKMGVQLTDAGRRKIRLASAAETDAQTALAKGISAQRSGSAVEALSYFYQAAAVDPTLTETAGRLNALSARISGGNLGQNVRTPSPHGRRGLPSSRTAPTFTRPTCPLILSMIRCSGRLAIPIMQTPPPIFRLPWTCPTS
jgi:hypothetical protein